MCPFVICAGGQTTRVRIRNIGYFNDVSYRYCQSKLDKMCYLLIVQCKNTLDSWFESDQVVLWWTWYSFFWILGMLTSRPENFRWKIRAENRFGSMWVCWFMENFWKFSIINSHKKSRNHPIGTQITVKYYLWFMVLARKITGNIPLRALLDCLRR